MNYKELPSHSKVWIYQANKPFEKDTINEIREQANNFVSQWATHGTMLKAAIEIFYDRFIVVFVDEEAVKASGCSIDSSVQFIKSIESEFGINLMDRMIVTWIKNEEVFGAHFSQIADLMEKGDLDDNTSFFNNLISTKEEFDQRWKIPFKETWMADRILA